MLTFGHYFAGDVDKPDRAKEFQRDHGIPGRADVASDGQPLDTGAGLDAKYLFRKADTRTPGSCRRLTYVSS